MHAILSSRHWRLFRAQITQPSFDNIYNAMPSAALNAKRSLRHNKKHAVSKDAVIPPNAIFSVH
jgi:hypothetical protein